MSESAAEFQQRYFDYMEYLLERTGQMVVELNEKGDEMQIPMGKRMWGCVMMLMRQAADLGVRLPNPVAKKDLIEAFEKLYDQRKAAAAADAPQTTAEK